MFFKSQIKKINTTIGFSTKEEVVKMTGDKGGHSSMNLDLDSSRTLLKGSSTNPPLGSLPTPPFNYHLYCIRFETPNPIEPHVSSTRKSTITTNILALIHLLCLKNIHVTKHDLFYTNVKLFQDQTQSDDVLDHVACRLSCTHSYLNDIAFEKGIVVEGLIFNNNGDMIDCTKMGMG